MLTKSVFLSILLFLGLATRDLYSASADPIAAEEGIELTSPDQSSVPEAQDAADGQDESRTGTPARREPSDAPESESPSSHAGQAEDSAPTNGESKPSVSAEPAAEPPLTSEQIALRDKLRRCLAYYFYHPDSARSRSPWEVMHCVIGFGVDTPLMTDDQQVNAIAWLCANGPCQGLRMLYANGDQVGVRWGAGYQGHQGQFLAILAQSRVKIDYPLIVNGKHLTMADLVKHEQLTCQPRTELTFKLIGLANYLDTDATWTSQDGQTWDIPRLIKEELAQPIVGAACGGTHRLMGFSYAVRKRERSGRPMEGQWKRAKKFVEDYHDYTLKLQNPDGSFSTNWFAQRGNWGDVERKLNTTGHTLEWLAYSLPEQRLTEPGVAKAVNYLTDLMWEHRGRSWGLGPKGHAVHALTIYDERVFGGQPGQRAVQLAQSREAMSTDGRDGSANEGQAAGLASAPENRSSNIERHATPSRSSRNRRVAR